MSRTRCGIVGVLFTVAVRVPALAGIADSPLPVLQAGDRTIHLYSVPGILANGDLETYFSCTSLEETATIRVGVEVFGAFGGSAANNAAATSVSVLPGATVNFGTATAASIFIDSNLGAGFLSRGSARILATSRKLTCTVYIADPGHEPPAAGWQLTIIAKTKQKAFN
jgi:hypothetical protein